MIVHLTISRRSFVFGQSRAKVCSCSRSICSCVLLPICPPVRSLSLTLPIGRRNQVVIGLCATLVQVYCDVFIVLLATEIRCEREIAN